MLMIEFEKWWNNRFPGNKEHHKVYHYREPKEAYRAALGFILVSLKTGWNAEDIVNFIVKELEETEE